MRYTLHIAYMKTILAFLSMAVVIAGLIWACRRWISGAEVDD